MHSIGYHVIRVILRAAQSWAGVRHTELTTQHIKEILRGEFISIVRRVGQEGIQKKDD